MELEALCCLMVEILTSRGGNGEKGYAHTPVSLQLVGGRWDDENVVEALFRIEKATGRSH